MSFRDDNFYAVHGWMVNRLNLSGNELLVYAVIYGFSQDGKARYTGSLEYLKSATNTSVSTVQRGLIRLVKKGLIKKQSYDTDQGMVCAYWANPETLPGQEQDRPHEQEVQVKMTTHPIQNDRRSMVKMTEGVGQNDRRSMVKMTNNNIIYNDLDNIIKKKEEEGADAPAFSLSQNLNPAQKDLMARFEGIKRTWNETGVLTPFRKLMFSPVELQNISPTLQAYSDEQISQAICNYAVIAQNTQEYTVGVDHSITFVNFIARWVERFTDEAKPFDRYKLKNLPSFTQKPQSHVLSSDRIEPGTKKYRRYF